jgi:tetratricopeptide (TPR) repeat protein
MEKNIDFLLSEKVLLDQKSKYFMENESEILLTISTKDDTYRLDAYNFLNSDLIPDLLEKKDYQKALILLYRIESDLRKMSFSDEKMAVLEKFQYNLAQALSFNKKYFKSRKAYEQLLHCRPDNKFYSQSWTKNEVFIASKYFNIALIILIPALVINLVILALNGDDWPVYLFIFLSVIASLSGIHRFYWELKSKE